MENLIESFGEGRVLFGAAILIGGIFGAAAQHSRFCLRAATIEFSQNTWGPRIAIWFVAFCAAVFGVQSLIAAGYLDVSDARQIATQGSLSGAVIGGLMFGSGMILARGCASRLLVLSGTGNLRAFVTGLILTLTAQASLRGVLSPFRESLSGIWTIPGGSSRNLLSHSTMSSTTVTLIAAVGLTMSIGYAWYHNNDLSRIVAAAVVGAAVSAGWFTTYSVAQSSFDIVPISSITFTGPSADTLMGLVNERRLQWSFGLGLVPGVFIGAFLMAWSTKEAKIQRFEPQMPMERYLLGGAMMGFGSMLAGGCAVGAGMSGGSIFALTAWLALISMWVGAVVTQRTLQSGLQKDSATGSTPS